MKTTAAQRAILESLVDSAQFTVDQARQESAALRGEFGPRRQIAAMAEWCKRLNASGQHVAAAALKAEAYAVQATALRGE